MLSGGIMKKSAEPYNSFCFVITYKPFKDLYMYILTVSILSDLFTCLVSEPFSQIIAGFWTFVFAEIRNEVVE